MLTFPQLRKSLYKQGPQIVQWVASSVIEEASLEPNGAVRITNFVTRRSYILPTHYRELSMRIVPKDELVQLGDLLPKSLRN